MSDIISLDYGSGGKKTSALIEKMIVPLLSNDVLNELGDSALVEGAPKLSFSTDSFVVSPRFFPGGNNEGGDRRTGGQSSHPVLKLCHGFFHGIFLANPFLRMIHGNCQVVSA